MCDATWRAVHTTRKRLTRIGAKPFKILKETAYDLKMHTFKPEFGIHINEETVTLKSDHLAKVDFWEVDPDWKGKLFKSVGQALRPRKKIPIKSNINLAPSSFGEMHCVRLVDVKGNQLHTVVKKL